METVSAGSRWVEQFLLPVLRCRGFLENGNSMRCLQIDPDDDTEAQRLAAEGHRCDVLVTAHVTGNGKEHWTRHYMKGRHQLSDDPFEVDLLSAACLVVRTDVCKQLGGMDESFTLYWVEAEMLGRLRRLGYRIYCVPRRSFIMRERVAVPGISGNVAA